MAEVRVGEQSSALSETINRQGWLSKRSRFSKRWDRRCCCLKKNELHYGCSAELPRFQRFSLVEKENLQFSALRHGGRASEEPRGTRELNKVIPLEGCELSDCIQDKRQFVFKIKPRGSQRVYFFCADTEHERQEWLQAICFAKATGNMSDGSQACSIQ